jgi:hypothetical protein
MSKNVPVNICPETNASWDMGDVRVISTADALSMRFTCISTQLSALRRTEVRTLSKIPGFTRISWQAFSTRCCNTSKSLIGLEYTRIFGCPHTQKSRGLVTAWKPQISQTDTAHYSFILCRPTSRRFACEGLSPKLGPTALLKFPLPPAFSLQWLVIKRTIVPVLN